MEFHIRCSPADISRYVFVPGSHERAGLIANHLDGKRLASESRGYRVYAGSYGGVPMTVCSTGMGGPSAAIALEELGHLGGDTFLRIGSCGAVHPDVGAGDVVVASGTYRGGGTANRYLPIEFPAAASFEMTRALVRAAAALALPAQVGIAWAVDAFYAPGGLEQREPLLQAGVKVIEMESDTLFVLAALRGWRAGALFASDGTVGEIKPEWGEQAYRQGEQDAIRIGLEAMLAVARADAFGTN